MAILIDRHVLTYICYYMAISSGFDYIKKEKKQKNELEFIGI